MGEVLLMKMFGDEIHHLFLSVKKIITKHHSKEIASRIHKILIRLTIKVGIIIEQTSTLTHYIPTDSLPVRKEDFECEHLVRSGQAHERGNGAVKQVLQCQSSSLSQAISSGRDIRSY